MPGLMLPVAAPPPRFSGEVECDLDEWDDVAERMGNAEVSDVMLEVADIVLEGEVVLQSVRGGGFCGKILAEDGGMTIGGVCEAVGEIAHTFAQEDRRA